MIFEKKTIFLQEAHPNKEKYPNQYIIYVRGSDLEVYAVPCVKESEDSIFLKTIFPSRTARKLYPLIN